MRNATRIIRASAAIAAIACLSCNLQVSAQAQSAIKIHADGSIAEQSGGPALLYLEGTASHLGLFTCFGEIDLVPGATEEEEDGTGVAAFIAANGDVLVGIVTAHLVHNQVSTIHFSWRDSVMFSDGPVASTGRFERSFPPGLLVSTRSLVCFIDPSTGKLYCSLSIR